jgi:hypothetical protein
MKSVYHHQQPTVVYVPEEYIYNKENVQQQQQLHPQPVRYVYQQSPVIHTQQYYQQPMQQQKHQVIPKPAIQSSDWARHHRVKPTWMKENRKTNLVPTLKVPNRWETEQRENFSYYRQFHNYTGTDIVEHNRRVDSQAQSNDRIQRTEYITHPPVTTELDTQRVEYHRADPVQSIPQQLYIPVDPIPPRSARSTTTDTTRQISSSRQSPAVTDRSRTPTPRTYPTPATAVEQEQPKETDERWRQFLEASIGYRPMKVVDSLQPSGREGPKKIHGKQIYKSKNKTSKKMLQALGRIPPSKDKRLLNDVRPTENDKPVLTRGNTSTSIQIPDNDNRQQIPVVTQQQHRDSSLPATSHHVHYQNDPQYYHYTPEYQHEIQEEAHFPQSPFTYYSVDVPPQFVRVEQEIEAQPRGENVYLTPEQLEETRRHYNRFTPSEHRDLNPKYYKHVPPTFTRLIRPAGNTTPATLTTADCFVYFE